MDEWNRHCRSGRQCGSAIQGLDRIWVRYLTDWVYSAITVAVAVAKWEGYGKLSSWDRIAERADAILIAASGSHVRASDGSVRIDAEHSRRLPVRHAHHRIDFNRRAQFSRQLVFALNGIPTAITDIAGIFDQHHHAGTDDREALRIVQGYGMLSAGQYEFLPCFLHVLEDAQIGLQIISGGGLDVGVSELSCDHADVGSGLDRQRAERVA